MSERLLRYLMLLSLCLFAACEPEGGGTSILLTVDSDFSVPDEIDRVTIEAAGMDEGVDEPSADLREQALPRSIALVHSGGPYGPFQIVVSAYLGTALVAQKTLQTSFLPNMRSRLAVNLSRGCANVFCGDGLTCSAGACVPVAESLPNASSQDAGASVDTDAALSVPSEAGSAGLDGGSSMGDAGVKLDAGANLDASAGSDASSAKDASSADARADTGTLGSTDASSLPVSGPGATPSCTIMKPAANDTVLTGVTFAVQGVCTDAELGTLTVVGWVSNMDGPIAMGSTSSATLRTTGAHNILLCAPDPYDTRVVGCATVHINATVQPTARILSVRQGTSASEPFAAGTAITIQGTATGAGATLRWRDSLQGSLGVGSTVTLNAPIVGRHVITLDVTDQYGLTASATRTILVAPGR